MSALLQQLLTWTGRALYRMGLGPAIIHLHRSAPKVLLYHGVAEDESDFTRGLGTNIRPASFAAHLDFLARHYRVIPGERLEIPAPPEGALAITFDDGYRSVYTHAFKELSTRGLTATVYLVCDVLREGRLVWVNELNWLLHRGGLPVRKVVAEFTGADFEALPIDLIDSVRRGCRPEEIDALLAQIREQTGLDARVQAEAKALYLTREDLAEMASRGFSFGNHTCYHASLPLLSVEAQRRQFVEAQVVVSELPGGRPAAAYPFGDCDESVRRTIAGLGFCSVMEVGGVNRPFDPQRVARVVAPDADVATLFAEIEIVTPLKARLKRLLRRG